MDYQTGSPGMDQYEGRGSAEALNFIWDLLFGGKKKSSSSTLYTGMPKAEKEPFRGTPTPLYTGMAKTEKEPFRGTPAGLYTGKICFNNYP